MTDRDKEYFYQGYEACLRTYAIWKNGEQKVGVMRRPLQKVIKEIRKHGDHELRVAEHAVIRAGL